MKNIALHIYSAISASWVVLNLTFWLIPFSIVAICKLLLPPLSSLWQRGVSFCYHGAARINSFWMLSVVRIRIIIDGDIGQHPSPVVISNHQSWFDIPVLHHVITDHGPIIKFLIKRQLIWVPVVGWLCWLLGFPRLYRGKGGESRKKDYATIRAFSERSSSDPGAVLIFAEGTRFSETKRIDQNSRFKHLLNPRMGGIRILKEAMHPDTPIIDITIVYVGGNSNCWDCLHGATREVRVVVKQHRVGDIEDLDSWINDRWQEKERLLESYS